MTLEIRRLHLASLCGPDGEPVLLEDLAASERVRAVARAAATSEQ